MIVYAWLSLYLLGVTECKTHIHIRRNESFGFLKRITHNITPLRLKKELM